MWACLVGRLDFQPDALWAWICLHVTGMRRRQKYSPFRDEYWLHLLIFGVLHVAVDGNWGSWERWSQVTVSCGSGMRDRRRRCDNPRPNYCGLPCPGPDEERELYDSRVPCIPVCGKSGLNWRELYDTRVPCQIVCGKSGLSWGELYDTRVPCEPVCGKSGLNWRELYDTRMPCRIVCSKSGLSWGKLCGTRLPCEIVCGKSGESCTIPECHVK